MNIIAATTLPTDATETTSCTKLICGYVAAVPMYPQTTNMLKTKIYNSVPIKFKGTEVLPFSCLALPNPTPPEGLTFKRSLKFRRSTVECVE